MPPVRGRSPNARPRANSAELAINSPQVEAARRQAEAAQKQRLDDTVRQFRALSKTDSGNRRSVPEAMKLMADAEHILPVNTKRRISIAPPPAPPVSGAKKRRNSVATQHIADAPAARAAEAPAAGKEKKGKKTKKVPLIDRLTRVVFLGLAVAIAVVVIDTTLTMTSSSLGVPIPNIRNITAALPLPTLLLGAPSEGAKGLVPKEAAGPLTLKNGGSSTAVVPADGRHMLMTAMRYTVLLPAQVLNFLVANAWSSETAATYGSLMEGGFAVGALLAFTMDI